MVVSAIKSTAFASGVTPFFFNSHARFETLISKIIKLLYY